MKSVWTSHLKTEDEKNNFRNQVQGSKHVLNRLIDILKIQEDELDKLELSTKIYDLPNWEYRQADMNGCRRAFQTIKTLLTIES